MIRRLIILLLIVGCEEPSKHGCLDGQAANYDATASIDNNTCTYIDSCGVIDIDLTNDCTQDDCGDWGGTGVLDECGVCDNDSTNDCIKDCANVWGGMAVIDECGVCGGNNTICKDCNGVINGEAELDNCGECAGGDTGLEACTYDCAGIWGGDAGLDECGVCNNYEEQPAFPYGTCDCEGTPNGAAWVSDCGCVSADNDGNDCDDCEGTPNGTAWVSDCGCVSADNDGNDCDDCEGTPNGTAVLDRCGVCNGDDSTCAYIGVSLEIRNVDTDAGTLDIYMTNTAGCNYCTDATYQYESECILYGSVNNNGVLDATWDFSSNIDEATCEAWDAATEVGINGDYFNGLVGGFQFYLSGVTITGASGGSAETAGFIIQVSETALLGFVFGGPPIPAGASTLTTISFSTFDGIDICLPYNQEGDPTFHTPIISDTSGEPIDTEVGDCYTIP